MRRVLAGLFFSILIGVGLAGGFLYLEGWLKAPGPLTAPAVVVIDKGSGEAEIARQLQAAGAIDQALLFRLGLRLNGDSRSLKAGEYALEAGATPLTIISKLARGDVLLHPVALPEGRTVKEIFATLESSEVLAGELPALPPEGSLLPQTYLVPRGEDRSRIVERMSAAMRKTLDAAWGQRAPDLPLASPEEALILASIIEKETARADEYPLVASVFANRLERGMRLQTDPSVIYGLTGGAGPLGRALTSADLQADNPWNTYRIAGLPPSPITNPGEAAIKAAVRPAQTAFLYFVADGNGGHAFASTLAEHNRNVSRWRRLQRDAKDGT